MSKWKTIDSAPKGHFKKVDVSINGKKGIKEVFIPEKILLFLDGKIYLTWAIEDGRWNGLSKKDEPTHWMPLPDAPTTLSFKE